MEKDLFYGEEPAGSELQAIDTNEIRKVKPVSFLNDIEFT